MIEPISASVTSYIGKKIVNIAETVIRTQVIERWSRYRAQQFFDAFCQSLLDAGISDKDIGKTLDELLEDEAKSELVFDAYRSVCLTKSKALGPRIIALHTAELVIANSKADSSDLLIFSAAEELSDSELNDFSAFALSWTGPTAQKCMGIELCDDGALKIQMGDETIDSNWYRKDSIPVGPLDLANDIGIWATKLKRLGLISDDVRERQWSYEDDKERYIDKPGVGREITWWLILSKESQELAKLVQRASV